MSVVGDTCADGGPRSDGGARQSAVSLRPTGNELRVAVGAQLGWPEARARPLRGVSGSRQPVVSINALHAARRNQRDEVRRCARGFSLLLEADRLLIEPGPPPRGVSYARHFVPPTTGCTAAICSSAWAAMASSEHLLVVGTDFCGGSPRARGHRLASRLTTIRFRGHGGRSASGLAAPELAMRDELMRDPAGLADVC